MSKKHRKLIQQNSVAGLDANAHAAEYRIIKHDLWKVLYLNAAYLILVFALYFTNSKTHYLEHWFGKLFKF